MHKEIQDALNHYRAEENRERGWSMDAEKTAYAVLKSACDKHGIEVSSLFRPNGVTIRGPARAVMSGEYGGPYIFNIFAPDAVLSESMTAGVTVHNIETVKHFDLMPGVAIIDHRHAA